MKQCFRPVTSIVAGLVLFACGCVQEPVIVEPHVVIADSAATRSSAWVQLLQGEDIVLRLPIPAGSGMRWRTVRQPSMDWNVMIMKDFIEQQPPGGNPGDPRWQVWQVRATKLGLLPLECVLDNRFAPEVPPAKAFVLTVEVVEKK